MNKLKTLTKNIPKILKNTKEEQERFARERFLMKKKNEDVFIIRKKNDE